MTEIIMIGIDLGATTVRAGAFTPTGELLKAHQTQIQAELGPEKGIPRILNLVEQLLIELDEVGIQRESLKGIGVGSTGPTDPVKGTLINPLTMPGWLNVPIVGPLASKFKVPVCLENDADAAALGEFWQGAGKIKEVVDIGVQGTPSSRLYAVTVGTGIGTSFILDGQIYRGAGGFHPEGGHQIVDPSGPLCYCGAYGCWESLSSGSAIGRAARQAVDSGRGEATRLLALAGGAVENIDAQTVAEAARMGDAMSAQIIDQAAQAFARGIHNIIMLFYPDTIVLSGGVMRSIDLFLPAANQVLQAANAYVPTSKIRILPAKLGYYAGIYGAAYGILMKIA